MSDEELDQDELDDATAEALPDREAMTVVDLGPGGPLGPPVFDVPLPDDADEVDPAAG